MIPEKIKRKLEKDKRMQQCLSCGSKPVQWHHSLNYKNKSIQEEYSLQPLCYSCHMGNSMKPDRRADVLSKIKAIEMGMKDLKKNYPKCNWEQELSRYKYEKERLDEEQKAMLNGYL